MIQRNNIKFIGYLFFIFSVSTIFSLLISFNTYKIGSISLILMFSIIIFFIQWIFFIHSYLFQTENYFDLIGSITFISIIISAFIIMNLNDLRSIVLFSLIIIWALRLGLFLFFRVKAKGFDNRFTSIKTDFINLFFVWNLQGMWILITISPALIGLLSIEKASMGILGYIGVSVWIIGFLIEIIADYQKIIFKSKKENKMKFINSGLWGWSRHPNYFGEIMIWFGITIIAIPVLIGWQFMSLLSPIFVSILLIKISGIPILEKNNHERWGNDSVYLNYLKTTPVLVPIPKKIIRSLLK